MDLVLPPSVTLISKTNPYKNIFSSPKKVRWLFPVYFLREAPPCFPKSHCHISILLTICPSVKLVICWLSFRMQLLDLYPNWVIRSSGCVAPSQCHWAQCVLYSYQSGATAILFTIAFFYVFIFLWLSILQKIIVFHAVFFPRIFSLWLIIYVFPLRSKDTQRQHDQWAVDHKLKKLSDFSIWVFVTTLQNCFKISQFIVLSIHTPRCVPTSLPRRISLPLGPQASQTSWKSQKLGTSKFRQPP